MRDRARTFPVSNVVLRVWGIGKDKKQRGLRYLERAGLISTKQIGSRSIEVTLLCTMGEDPEGGQ